MRREPTGGPLLRGLLVCKWNPTSGLPHFGGGDKHHGIRNIHVNCTFSFPFRGKAGMGATSLHSLLSDLSPLLPQKFGIFGQL
jgi:hypothetical protein